MENESILGKGKWTVQRSLPELQQAEKAKQLFLSNPWLYSWGKYLTGNEACLADQQFTTFEFLVASKIWSEGVLLQSKLSCELPVHIG